ncbi:J domain-containing protein [Candidatus Albibeggiatoa sp. nov. BB20]|uniref:J domain-containing protein n=1 Tax=Candidatus Albibeggiatoa sp. nov. BB20 TaxID=3162723 RepID=UPI0033657A94
MKNYYQILGISPNTDPSEIKAAAQAKANEINEAFRVLNDPEKRQAYDLSLLPKQPEAEPLKPVPKPQIAQSTATPPKFKVSGESRRRFTDMIGSWSEYLRIEAPTSLRDVVIFMLAVVFLLYMLGQFLFPPPINPPSQPSLSLGTYSSTASKN